MQFYHLHVIGADGGFTISGIMEGKKEPNGNIKKAQRHGNLFECRGRRVKKISETNERGDPMSSEIKANVWCVRGALQWC